VPDIRGKLTRERSLNEANNDQANGAIDDPTNIRILELGGVASLNRSIREVQRRDLIRRATIRHYIYLVIYPVIAHIIRSLNLFRSESQRELRIIVDLLNAVLPDYNDGFLELRIED